MIQLKMAMQSHSSNAPAWLSLRAKQLRASCGRDFRSNDRDREWEKEGDEITSVLKPSFVLQSPMVQPTDPKLTWGVPDGLRVAVGLVEVRVEVLWGKAYLAIVYPEGLDHIEPLVTRPNGTSAGGRRERPALCPV